MGGLQATSARRSVLRAAVALGIACLLTGLVLFAVGRLPGQTGSPLLSHWLGRSSPQSAIGASGVGGPRLRPAGSRPATTVDPATKAAELALAGPSPPPTRMTIPKLGVDAVVEAVGVAADGTMAVPSSPDRVAWYQPGVRPGDAGDALFDGHLDWGTGPGG